VFQVDEGVTASIAGLTIADGSASCGGGIDNEGALTIANSTLAGNSAAIDGGGIFSGNINGVESALVVTNSTLAGNSASNVGGGIAVGLDSAATVTNSTLSRNSARSAGGIDAESDVTVTNSTLSGNSASSVDGGIATVTGSQVTLASTIIAGNSAPTGPDVHLTINSLGYNLIGNSSGGIGFVATDLLGVNPLLGPLENNGGPTETMALLPGSPALGAGRLALAVDANGNPLT
jgi:hypothetical protein